MCDCVCMCVCVCVYVCLSTFRGSHTVSSCMAHAGCVCIADFTSVGRYQHQGPQFLSSSSGFPAISLGFTNFDEIFCVCDGCLIQP